MEVHFPDIPESTFGWDYFNENNPDEAMWEHWITDAYMGDAAVFDTEFTLRNISTSPEKPNGKKDK
jgi:hypothetical protein